MAIGGPFNPKTLKQLAVDAAELATRRIKSTITPVLTKTKVDGEEFYKCSVRMIVEVKNKNSKIAQRQILDVQKRVRELNEKLDRKEIKLNLNKSEARKKWMRCKRIKTIDFECQFSFSVIDKELISLGNTSKYIVQHIEELMIVYHEDKYRLKYKIGSRTESVSSDDTVEIKNNPDEITPEKEKQIEDKTDSDIAAGLKVQSHDPQYHIKSDAGNIHFEDKSKKTHYHIFNCFNTGRKDGKGCFSTLFGVFKSCLPCIFKKT